MHARWPILALTLALASPRVAGAQPNDKPPATALFQQGRDAAKRGDYETAVARMQESYRLEPALGTLLNLADAHEHLGHVATAWRLFQQAHDQLPPRDDRRPSAKQRIDALEPRVPRLTLTLAIGSPSGARVARDGKELGANEIGVAAPLDPGSHEITVSAPGREPRRYAVAVAERRSENLVVEPGPEVAVAAIPDRPRPSRSNKLRIAGFAVGGAGLVSIGAAIATGLMLPGKKKTVDAHCGALVGLPADRCDAAGFDAAKSGKALAGINTVAWIVGGAAVATGVTLVIVGSVGGEKAGEPPPAQPAASIELRAQPGFAGATIGGRF